MFDLNRSYFNDIKERAVAPAPALPIEEEGTALIYVSDGAGGIAVTPSAGVAAEEFAGFAITDALKYLTEVVVEEVVVPAAAPFTLNLKHQNIITTEVYVYDVTAAVAMTPLNPPGPGQYWLTSAGVLAFNLADAGHTVTVQYRYNLTFAEIIEKYHERSINNRAQDYFSTVSVGCMEGEIFTSMFDASQAYTAPGDIFLGAAGKLTSAGGGTKVGTCTQVPSTANGLLGVKFRTA